MATNELADGCKLARIDCEASVMDASKLMRASRVTELLVIDESHGPVFGFAILTANDIVTRVIAAGLDPAVLTAGDIAQFGSETADAAMPGAG
jgi:CBS domain-containing protein